MPVARSKTRKPVTVKSLGEVSDAYSVSADTVKRWRSEGMPGKSQQWVLKDISHWLRTDGPWRQNAKAPVPIGEDLLLSEGDSPALERYRLAKAKHAELDLEHRKGELIEVTPCREALARWAVLIRRMGERLAKRYGNDASEMVNESLEECRAVVRESLG
jgi:phage terminase Nu1 subunit (DNA packaging protein)